MEKGNKIKVAHSFSDGDFIVEKNTIGVIINNINQESVEVVINNKIYCCEIKNLELVRKLSKGDLVKIDGRTGIIFDLFEENGEMIYLIERHGKVGRWWFKESDIEIC